MSYAADEHPPAQSAADTPGHSLAHEAVRSPLVLRGNGVSCRVLQWSRQPDTAQLVLYQQSRLPTAADLERWLQHLHSLGYVRVRTSALSTPAGLRVESAGFTTLQELALLEHTEPRAAAGAGIATPKTDTSTRRLVVAQHAQASVVDLAAFGTAWALDEQAIHDVCAATPRHRARAAGEPLAAYAVTGRDSKQGFLQRLAVAPDQQRLGLGRALVLDSLQWLARWRVRRVLVNTPTDNLAALALYEQTGFRRLSERLRVYERTLT